VVISAWLWWVFPWNLVQISLSNPELLIFFFQNERWRSPPSWICLCEPWDHPRSLIHGAYLLWKFCHDRLSSFLVIRIWFFSRSGLKVPLTPPKFQFLGILPPKFRDTSFRPPKGTFLSGTTRFEPSLVQIGRTDHPRRRIEVKVCMPGGRWCVVLYFKFY